MNPLLISLDNYSTFVSVQVRPHEMKALKSFDEYGKLKIEMGDVITVLDGKPGQLQHSMAINPFSFDWNMFRLNSLRLDEKGKLRHWIFFSPPQSMRIGRDRTSVLARWAVSRERCWIHSGAARGRTSANR